MKKAIIDANIIINVWRLEIDPSTGTRLYKGSSEILESILDSFRQSSVLWCKEFDLKGTSSLNKLELYYKKHSFQFIISPDRAKVYWLALINSEGELFEKVRAIHFAFKKWICKTIEEGQKNGEITSEFNSDNLSTIISGNIYLYCRRSAFNSDCDFEKNIPEIWKMIETMLRVN